MGVVPLGRDAHGFLLPKFPTPKGVYRAADAGLGWGHAPARPFASAPFAALRLSDPAGGHLGRRGFAQQLHPQRRLEHAQQLGRRSGPDERSRHRHHLRAERGPHDRTRITDALQIVVTGTGSDTANFVVSDRALTTSFFVVIGAATSSGRGAMTIQLGGKVTCDGGVIGFINGSPGSVRVTGAGSTWTNNTSLNLGGFNADLLGGVGTLLIEPGGLVRATGPTTFWTPGCRIDVAGGQLVTGSLSAVAPDALVTLSDSNEFLPALRLGGDGSTSTYSGTLTNGNAGPGGLVKEGAGTVTLDGTLSYTGHTLVAAGTLEVPRTNLYATSLEVADGATFRFTGVWGTNNVSQTAIRAGGRISGSGTLRGSVDNAGLFEVAAGRSLLLGGTFQNSGRVRVSAGTTLISVTPFINSGVLDLISASSAALTNLPNLVNTGTILDRHSLRPTVTAAGPTGVQIAASGFAGHAYQLQRSASLDGTFADLGQPITLTSDGPLSFTDSTPPPGQGFYRIRVD